MIDINSDNLQNEEEIAESDNLYVYIKEIAKNSRNERYKEISTYIARIEHFCVGVNLEIYDRKTIYNLAHGFLDGTILKRIEPIMNRKNFDGNEYYDNTKKVIAWMNEETKKLREEMGEMQNI